MVGQRLEPVSRFGMSVFRRTTALHHNKPPEHRPDFADSERLAVRRRRVAAAINGRLRQISSRPP